MFTIHDCTDHLLIELHDDFDYRSLRIMLHVMKLPEYRELNDIWLIGQHRALLRMNELDDIVNDVMLLYPENATRNKTALVIDSGITEAIADFLLDSGKNKLPFKMKIFHTLEEARKWLGTGRPTEA